MTELFSSLPFQAGRDLGWTLIHFLWQGALLAALLNAALPLCRTVTAKHTCALVTLALMVLAPIATFAVLHDANGTGIAADGPPASPSPAWMNGLVIAWLAGIVTLSLRALGGWHMVQSLKRRDTLAVPGELLQRCQSLQRRLAVAWPVRFLLSRRIDAPMVVGWLRPVILIPVSAIAGLSAQQLDALILHELAHIRRLDTFTNILLVGVETVLFYHPAVWWVSRQVRTLREHCCDDVAVAAFGDAATYVEALTALAPWKAAGRMALAANGGQLKHRVARLLDGRCEPRRLSLSALTGLALLSLLAGSVAMAQTGHRAAAMTELRPIRETHTLPPYPKESIHLKEQGRVKLAVTIGTDGAVSRASVVEPSGHSRLDDAALQFVKKNWRWQPATRAGKPVAASTKVSVLFNLKDTPGPAPQPKAR
jgi:bla regulator protein blaR1